MSKEGWESVKDETHTRRPKSSSDELHVKEWKILKKIVAVMSAWNNDFWLPERNEWAYDPDTIDQLRVFHTQREPSPKNDDKVAQIKINS